MSTPEQAALALYQVTCEAISLLKPDDAKRLSSLLHEEGAQPMTWQEALTIKVRTKHPTQDRVRITNAEFRQALRDGNAVPGAGLIDLYASGDFSISSMFNGTRRNVAIGDVALVLAVLNIINADWL